MYQYSGLAAIPNSIYYAASGGQLTGASWTGCVQMLTVPTVDLPSPVLPLSATWISGKHSHVVGVKYISAINQLVVGLMDGFVVCLHPDDIVTSESSKKKPKLISITKHTSPIECIDVFQNYICTANTVGQINLFDFATKQSVIQLCHPSYITAVSVNHATTGEETLIASGSADGVGIWDTKLTPSKPVHSLLPTTDEITPSSIAFHSTEPHILALGLMDGSVLVYDLRQHERALNTVVVENAPVHALDWSKSGMLAVGGDDKTVKIFDTQTSKELFSYTGHQDQVRSVLFDERKEQPYLLSASWDGTVVRHTIKL